MMGGTINSLVDCEGDHMCVFACARATQPSSPWIHKATAEILA